MYIKQKYWQNLFILMQIKKSAVMVQSRLPKIEIKSTLNYHIIVGSSLFDFSVWLGKKTYSRIVIITDNIVKKYYGSKLNILLKTAGYDSLLLSFPAGEKYKNNKTKQKIEDKMLACSCDRAILIVALGGGVVGDIAGFIAATYLRGVPYLQIPTTLLAMVDSSIGGKTGVNTNYGKNLIGVIYQPECVLADIALLKTLTYKHKINGLVEAIKMFLTHDTNAFYYTVTNLQQIIRGEELILQNLINRAIEIKAGVVARDEKEQGERNLLNFGHTIGHALEKLSNYKLLHGFAVAYGILVEANISYLFGLLCFKELLEITDLMAKLGFYGKDLTKYQINKVLQATNYDKKSSFNKVRYSLLKKIGKGYVKEETYTHHVPDHITKAALINTISQHKQQQYFIAPPI